MKKILVFILLVFTFSSAFAGRNFLGSVFRPSPLRNSNRGAIGLQNTYRKIYQLYSKSVVSISYKETKNYSRKPSGDSGYDKYFSGGNFTSEVTFLGSGFIISPDGYVATNHHVVKDKKIVNVTAEEKNYKAEVIASDKLTDVALLKIQAKRRFTPVYFGNSQRVHVGDLVIAIGNPHGLEKTFTTGVISAKSRDSIDAIGIPYLQTDTSVNPGNSGGPLIDIHGQVVGVNSMIYTSSGGSQGLNFAIPINTVRKALLDLKRYKKVRRGFIGVNITHLSDIAAKSMGLKDNLGAMVAIVKPGGPADKGGLKQDDIILYVNNYRIKDYRTLLRIISRSPIDKKVKLTIWRNGKKSVLTIIVRERP